MASKNKIQVLPEQILVAAQVEDRVALGGSLYDRVPWHLLPRCCVYALEERDLKALLRDAVDNDYMILDGSSSDRRGLRGFRVGIGAWGHAGTVECRTLDAWCLEPGMSTDRIEDTALLQQRLRATCRRLNAEKITFRGSALRWLSALYRKMNLEPDDVADPLPVDLSLFCRRGHIGGPIVHARTRLAPFTTIDRDRAYGSAMLEDLPTGRPYDVPIKGDGIHRWRPRDLKSMMGVAEATVLVHPGPFAPLMPVMRWHPVARNTKTIYPTGTLRGVWPIHELVYLEESGRGEVRQLHRVVTFEPRPVFAPMIRYLRRLEPELSIKVKRLEHMLYGNCARTLQMTRFATGYDGGQPLLGDLVNPNVLRRLGPDATIRSFAVPGAKISRHRLYEISGRITGQAPHGTMDRPDRSAWITATNRIEMCKLMDQLDEALGAERSGSYVGRIYVDGMDVEATPDQIPKLEGASVRRNGPEVNIYRAGAYAARCHDNSLFIEAAGLPLPVGCTESDLVKTLRQSLDLQDHGPFAGGRSWPHVDGEDDPRLIPDQRSEPLHVDLEMLEMLGFI